MTNSACRKLPTVDISDPESILLSRRIYPESISGRLSKALHPRLVRMRGRIAYETLRSQPPRRRPYPPRRSSIQGRRGPGARVRVGRRPKYKRCVRDERYGTIELFASWTTHESWTTAEVQAMQHRRCSAGDSAMQYRRCSNGDAVHAIRRCSNGDAAKAMQYRQDAARAARAAMAPMRHRK